MTAFVLSLTVMSGLEFLHKSRLLSKQRLAEKKKARRESGSHNRSKQHVIPCLLVGWFWSNRIWLERPIVTPGQPASQPASQSAGQPAAQTRPGFLILVTCMQRGICWKEAPHALAFFYGTIRRNASPLTNAVWTRVQFFLFSYCCSPNHDSHPHPGSKAPWEQEQRRGKTSRAVSAQEGWNQPPLLCHFPNLNTQRTVVCCNIFTSDFCVQTQNNGL